MTVVQHLYTIIQLSRDSLPVHQQWSGSQLTEGLFTTCSCLFAGTSYSQPTEVNSQQGVRFWEILLCAHQHFLFWGVGGWGVGGDQEPTSNWSSGSCVLLISHPRNFAAFRIDAANFTLCWWGRSEAKRLPFSPLSGLGLGCKEIERNKFFLSLLQCNKQTYCFCCTQFEVEITEKSSFSFRYITL